MSKNDSVLKRVEWWLPPEKENQIKQRLIPEVGGWGADQRIHDINTRRYQAFQKGEDFTGIID